MHLRTSFLPLLVSLLLAGPAGRAQTATWIAPGIQGTRADWNDPANWDTGAVPAGATATAVLTQATNAVITNPIPGGAQPVLTGNVTLGSLQFNLPGFDTTRFTGIYIGDFTFPTAQPGTLRLEGAGLNVTQSGTSAITAVTLALRPDSTLEFANHAVLSRSGVTTLGLLLFGLAGQPATVRFRDDATIAPGAIGSINFIGQPAVIEFLDRSRAGDTVFALPYNASVRFLGQASAENASFVPSGDLTGSLTFGENSSADHATLRVRQTVFQDQATAAAATIQNLGVQYYSSHGAFIEYYSDLQFLDASTAAQATITNNEFGRLTFSGQSNAAAALITNRGTLVFSGASAFTNAQLTSNEGQMGVYLGYNQSGYVPTGRVYFQDQATGGNGRIMIDGANTILDFSGLYTGNGTTGRAPLPAAPTGPAVFPDDQASISFGSITNLSPGGTLYLGGSVLAIGGDNRDMTLSARISDQGGRFGSAAGAPLAGGTLYKTGTGTLTISNPGNSYAGSTAIFDGTLNLAGGTIFNAYVNQTGRLTGTGLVRGSLYNGFFGTATLVSPGNSVGTITVQGDYQQSAIGTLRMEIASATSYDQLLVGGIATLAGTLNLSFLNGQMPVGNATYGLLSATGRNGQFVTVNFPAAGAALGTHLVYTSTGVSLLVTQNSFAGFAAGSPAGGALGAHLDATLATATGDYRNLIAGLNTLDAAHLAPALEALAPDRYAVLPAHGFLTATAQQAARDRLFSGLRANPARGFDLFFEATHRSAKFAALAGLPAAKATLDGGTVGGAWHNGAFALGAALTQESGDMDPDALGSRANLESLVPVVFFQYAPDRFFLNASAAFSQDDYDLRRRIVYSGVDLTATAAPAGRRTDLALTVGYALHAGAWSWTPQVGLLHSRWAIDDFAETGAAGADLAVAGWSAPSLRTRAGLELGTSGRSFAPRLAVFWLHEMEDDRSIPAKFAGATGAPYAAPGRPVDRNLVQAAVGFDWQLGRRASLNATFAGAWGGDSRLTADLSAGFQWRF